MQLHVWCLLGIADQRGEFNAVPLFGRRRCRRPVFLAAAAAGRRSGKRSRGSELPLATPFSLDEAVVPVGEDRTLIRVVDEADAQILDQQIEPLGRGAGAV